LLPLPPIVLVPFERHARHAVLHASCQLKVLPKKKLAEDTGVSKGTIRLYQRVAIALPEPSTEEGPFPLCPCVTLHDDCVAIALFFQDMPFKCD
jgi:hypothetical protein